MPAFSHLSLLAAVSSLSGAQFGFDTAIISGALVSIHSDLLPSSPASPAPGINGTLPITDRRPLTAGEQELIVSVTTVGAIIGALASAYLSRFWGRRTLTMISSILFALGSIEQAASQYIRELVLGRAIVGLAIGLASMITPTYLSEVCPADIRGRLVGLNIFFVTAGQVIAYVVSAAMYHLPHSWRWMILMGVVPAVVQLAGVLYLDESPRWLVSRGRERHAREVLKRIYPLWSDSHIQAEVETIKASSGGTTDNSEATSTSSVRAPARLKERRSEIMTIFRNRANRKALFLACGLQVFQQLCGFNALCYFGASILRMTGFRSNPVLAALPIAIANCVGTAIAMRLVDRPRFGRRKLLLWTTAFAAIWLALLGAALLGVRDLGDVVEHAQLTAEDLKPEPTSVFAPPSMLRDFYVRQQNNSAVLTNSTSLLATPTTSSFAANATSGAASLLSKPVAPPSSWAIVSLLCMVAFTLSYALGLGVVPWIVQAEALGADVRLRAVGGALATASNWGANLCVSSVFLHLVRAITLPGSFWLYSAITVLAWVFTWYNLPEMSGLDIDQTSRMFEGSGPGSSSSAPYRPVRAQDDVDEEGDAGRGLLSNGFGKQGRGPASSSRGDEDVWRVHDSDEEDEEEEEAEGHAVSAGWKKSQAGQVEIKLPHLVLPSLPHDHEGTRIQHTRPHQDDSRASTAVKNSKNPRGVQRDPFIYPSNSHFIRAKRLVGNPPLDLSETS
ncbi:hypothetical protein A4X13_0g3377 [Tilletia indica]|uniref:Major facilitator superfamily (MFS) profile domain-containing protein n=1 Tax=Tilletia indica TaxID=43049 RepID=A0A8T8T3J3_9BASI|nr:hypothetical protein A4X13_0g3377 [Tilletia indica]